MAIHDEKWPKEGDKVTITGSPAKHPKQAYFLLPVRDLTTDKEMLWKVPSEFMKQIIEARDKALAEPLLPLPWWKEAINKIFHPLVPFEPPASKEKEFKQRVFHVSKTDRGYEIEPTEESK